MQAWPLTGRAEELRVITDVFLAGGRDAGVVIAAPADVEVPSFAVINF